MISNGQLLHRADSIAADLARDGISVATDVLSPNLVFSLTAEARTQWEQDQYRLAQIGTGDTKQHATEVRSDRVRWWDDAELSDPQRAYKAELEQLRVAINRTTMLGLFEWEGHYACYPPGGHYRRHLDVFANARDRQVSTILYLNDDWRPRDGGELRIWTQAAGPDWALDSLTIDVEPRAGTLVVFLSEDIYHEVLPTRADRFSVSGWFRTRPTTVL